MDSWFKLRRRTHMGSTHPLCWKMTEVEQGEIGDPHDIEWLQAPQADDNEVIIGDRGPNVDTGGPFNDDAEDMNDGEPESSDNSNDKVSEDPMGGPCTPSRCRSGHKVSQGIIKPEGLVLINVNAKCPIFLARDDKDAGSYLLYSNDWMRFHKALQKMQNPSMIWRICKGFYQTIL